MEKVINKKQRALKEQIILDAAHVVFCQKGFLTVTMKDIVEAASISRGGLYLYYASVSDVFLATIERRNRDKFEVIQEKIHLNENFDVVLFEFMSLQKKRLLNMDDSLLRAMYEYLFSDTIGATQAFKKGQFEHLQKSLNEMFNLGIKQKIILKKNIVSLVNHYIIMIEGLGILALTEVLTENIIDEQFELLTLLVNKERIPVNAQKGENYEQNV